MIKRRKGFALIELMITVAIIAILAAIAYPSYLEQIKKSRRAVAQGVLEAFSISMERYFTERQVPSYSGAAQSGSLPQPPKSTVFPSEAPLDGANKFYDLKITSLGAGTTTPFYSLSAAPKNAQAGDKCGTFTLDSTGTRGVSGASAGVTWQDCWK